MIRPTRAQILASGEKTIPDIISPNLRVLFCGINPGLYSAAVGHHFARPGNRFWPALHSGGFTPRLYSPDEGLLLTHGFGITNVVARASAGESDLSAEELRAGAEILIAKIRRYRPKVLAILGVGAYRIGFNQRKAAVGLQDQKIDATRIWILPNPSGLNAHYQAPALAEAFGELREFAESL